MGGQNRQNGTAPPLKKAKDKSNVDRRGMSPDEDDLRAQEARKKAEAQRKEMAKQIAGKKGPLNTGSQGIKKSGKK
ncbi:hypothetical protein E4U43_003428 [Claviceps pusilla]|uniref:Uncharacterized protein n=1 Tax=Claviceps pusilla TaxID=123648 RepID=A0A9P7SXK1_9HYPO|nr:hypothetical protein E4U43_003428 [Claviceps pusilla]